jgi:hypothetical protein
VGIEFKGILPIKFTKKKVKNRKKRINLPTLDLTAESKASNKSAFKDERRLE